MGNLFNMEGPIMSALSKIADLVWLNILALICCIPIFTIGASLTSVYYVTLKMVKNEESYITRSFFKAFRENFKQSTIIWLIMLVLISVFGLDFYIYTTGALNLPMAVMVIIGFFAILCSLAFVYIFPVLSRFDNTVKNTIVNSFIMAVAHFPKTFLMLIINILPIVIVLLVPQAFPVLFLAGISGVAYLCSLFLRGIFLRYEDLMEERAKQKEEAETLEQSLENKQ